jgi:ADP-heptose:LPS heptosyltransferase
LETTGAALTHKEAECRREDLNGLFLSGENRKTIVFSSVGLGDFLMLTPALQRLSEGIGKENLHLLALRPTVAELAEASGYFEHVYYWNPSTETLFAGFDLLLKLRRQRFDYSLSTFPSADLRFSIVCAMVYARTRIGFRYQHEWSPRLVQTISVPIQHDIHDTDQNCDLIDVLLGEDNSNKPRELKFPNQRVTDRSSSPPSKAFFVCHPGSSAKLGMKEKRLPPAVFAELISKIHSRFGLSCVLIGGPEEQPLREQIGSLAPLAILPYELAHLSDLKQVVDQSLFFLGNDSGLMHAAVAAGKKCVSFFGPTDERRTGPYDQNLRQGTTMHLIVRKSGLACSPCWTTHTLTQNPPCIYADTRCLTNLEVSEIWEKIEPYIAALLTEEKAVVSR